MQIPSIKIKYNLNEEVRVFLTFLHHPQFPQNRNKIFKAFPELKIALDRRSKVKEEIVIKNFIKNFYKKYDYKIKKIINQSREMLRKKSKMALDILSFLMDYKWSENISYIAMPTILPFSPYKKNVFYFSILGTIYNKKQHNILFVSVHEISHIILYEILKKKYGRSFFQKRVAFYFLKEILAPVIMNQKSLCSLLQIKDYVGNPFLKRVFIINKSKKNQITDFFQKLYEEARDKKGMNFNQILKIMTQLIFSIENELAKKNKIWNQYGNNLVNNKIAFKKYRQPIKIKVSEQLFN